MALGDTMNGAYQTQGNPLGNLPSLLGTGGAIYNQGQIYSQLQNALKTIGPTALQGWNLNGPGGMSTGFNPATGSANINLGSLNPAYSGFAGAAGAGANSYNAGLPSFLSGNALSTLSPAMGALGSAYGNYGAGMGAANAQLGNLGNFGSTYNNLLQAQYGQLAPQIQQQAFGLQNTLFGNGVADSTGAASGSLAAQNFGRGVGQAQSTAQLNAFQQALAQQNSAATNYGTLSNSANGILANAFNNFGNTNQLISGLNTAGLNNAGTAAQGAGALNTLGLNNYNASLQSGVAQGTVRNQSLFPYASVATALSQTPTALGLGSSALSQMGANGGFNIPGLSSLNNYYQSMFGGGGVTAGDMSGYSSGITDALNGTGSGFTGAGDIGSGLAGDSTYANALNMMGPTTASGGAAAPMVASDAQATSNAAFDAYSASAGDAAGAAAAGGAIPTAAGVGADSLGGAAAANAGASFGAADAGSGAAAGGAGLAVGAGAGALAAMYGMYMLDQKQSQYNPLDAYGDLMTSSKGMSPSNAAAYQDIARRELTSPGSTGLFNVAGMSPSKVKGYKQ